MQNIEEVAIQTYRTNLEYFEKNHKPIYDKINLLNTLIEEGKYIEKYTLEYKEEGYFDILEISSNEYLYKENSIDHAKRMVDMVDLKRTGAIFKAQKLNLATNEQAEIIDKSKLSFHNALWATIKLTNYVSDHATSETYMNRATKIIFLEIGLGLHIEKIIDKLNSQIIFINEKNLETFRLSLFVTNYKELSINRFLYFSITNKENEERENFIQFLNKGNNYNLHIKHVPFMPNYQPELQKLQSHVLSQSYIAYGYSAMLLRYIDSTKYLTRGYSFLNVDKRHTNNILSKKPVLFLFSGPSTLKNINWVKDNRDKFIVATALSTCKLLDANNITPDIVVHIDPGENSSLLFEGLDAETYFQNTTAILSSNVDETTISRFNYSKIHLVEQGTKYKKGFGQFTAPSVGEYTYGLFLILGATNIFMLGIDLALDSETYQSHGEYHPFDTKGEIDHKNPSLNPNTSVSLIKGNFIEQVPSNSIYKMSIFQFEHFTKMFKSDTQYAYNLSDGAYLEGAEPLKIKDYNWNQFDKLDNVQKELDIFFADIGSDDFNNEDKGQLKYQIKEAKKLEKLIKAFKKKKFINTDAYLNSLSQLSWDLSDMDYKTNSDLAQVYYEYFPIMLSYIYDLFNTKELSNPNKHIVQINNILIEQLLKISSLYISKLEMALQPSLKK